MVFKNSESTIKPATVEEISGNRVLVRKNIKAETRIDKKEQEYTVYVYQEAVMTADEYFIWQCTNDINVRHENDIKDDYTLKLIEEGVI